MINSLVAGISFLQELGVSGESIYEHRNGCEGKSVTIEGHFVHSYHCSCNQVKVTVKY